MIEILINGINGKLGRAVYSLAEMRSDVAVTCGVDKKTIGNFNCPVYSSIFDFDGRTDAVIDFSSPSALDGLLDFCTEAACPLLLATTGYTDEQVQKIEHVSEKIPICLASNLSLGIATLMQSIPVFAKALSFYDVTVTEAHRKGKRDKPSGTALTIKKALEQNGKSAEVLSIRGGDLPGTHEVLFIGDNEYVSIKHEALSRNVFAEGAINICLKLKDLPSGLYGNELLL